MVPRCCVLKPYPLILPPHKPHKHLLHSIRLPKPHHQPLRPPQNRPQESNLTIPLIYIIRVDTDLVDPQHPAFIWMSKPEQRKREGAGDPGRLGFDLKGDEAGGGMGLTRSR